MADHPGKFEQLVLLAVVRIEDSAYGVPIRQKTAERTRVRIGASNAALDRLEAKGYLHSWFGNATPQRGGRSNRFFQLLSKGAEALTRSKSILDRMCQGVDVNRRADA